MRSSVVLSFAILIWVTAFPCYTREGFGSETILASVTDSVKNGRPIQSPPERSDGPWNRVVEGSEAVADRLVKAPLSLVNLQTIVPDIAVEMRYAGSDNFTGKKIYKCGRCFLRPGTAAKVAIAQDELKKRGLSLKMWDCYRPPAAQRLFWSLVPDPRYVADPKTGSRHSRGNAVDVTLVDLSGRELEMPTRFDDFSLRAGHGEKNLPPGIVKNRRILLETMEKAGFKRYESEWWHYDDRDGEGEIVDLPFDELCR